MLYLLLDRGFAPWWLPPQEGQDTQSIHFALSTSLLLWEVRDDVAKLERPRGSSRLRILPFGFRRLGAWVELNVRCCQAIERSPNSQQRAPGEERRAGCGGSPCDWEVARSCHSSESGHSLLAVSVILSLALRDRVQRASPSVDLSLLRPHDRNSCSSKGLVRWP